MESIYPYCEVPSSYISPIVHGINPALLAPKLHYMHKLFLRFTGYFYFAMEQESIRKLDQVFRSVFYLTEDANVFSLTRNGEVPWDSLSFVTLIAAIESEFDCNIDVADALRLDSYQAARSLLEQKGF